DGDVLAVDVARHAPLHRGAAVAEQIERYADARREIFPVLDSADASSLRIIAAVGTLAIVLAAVEPAGQHVALLRLADEPVVAQSRVHRGAADGPFVLHIDAGVGLDAVAPIGRQPQRDGRGSAVGVLDGLHVPGVL